MAAPSYLGWFKFDKEENMDEFCRKAGLEEYIPGMREYRYHMAYDEATGKFTTNEFFSGTVITTSYKCGIESDYITGDPRTDRKFVVTDLGKGRYQWDLTGKNAQSECWVIEPQANGGLLMNGLDKKTGEKCKMWVKPDGPKTTGWFEYDSSENLEEYTKAAGMGEFIPAMKEYVYLMTHDEKTGCFTMKEFWGDTVEVTTFKVGVEGEYAPSVPKMTRKFLVTDLGGGKYQWDLKGKNGEAETWTIEALPNGKQVMCGHDKRTDMRCKMWVKPYNPKVTGWFKFDREENMKDYLEKAGMSEYIDTMKNYHYLMLYDGKTDTYTMTEFFDGHKVVNSFKIGVESDYTGGDPKMDRRILVKDRGDGQFCWDLKSKDGKEEVWKIDPLPCGELLMSGTDKKTGEKMKLWMKGYEPKTTGWFKYLKDENMDNYIKKSGMGEQFIPAMKNYRYHMAHDKSTGSFTHTEYWGGPETRNQSTFQIGKEETYHFPADPNLNRKYKVSDLGGGRYTWKTEGAKGERETWSIEPLPSGEQLMTGQDHRTGEQCKIWVKPYVEICGKFRPCVIQGFEDLGKALSMPKDLINKLNNDYGARLIISEEKDGKIKEHYDSPHAPAKATFEWNKEFDFCWDSMPGVVFKAIQTWNRDTQVTITKMGPVTIQGTRKFTDNFIVETTSIVGNHDAACRVVFERIEF